MGIHIMKDKDKEKVMQRIEQEGFDYCFVNYSSFKEIKDVKFHELRKKYLRAQEELEAYVKPDYFDGDV